MKVSNVVSGADNSEDGSFFNLKNNTVTKIEGEENDLEDESTSINGPLGEFLSFYDCYELIPYAHHILWLSSLKEAIGEIPSSFMLDWDDYRALVILKEEQSRKSVKDSQDMSKKGDSNNRMDNYSGSGSSSGKLRTGRVNVPVSKMIIKK